MVDDEISTAWNSSRNLLSLIFQDGSSDTGFKLYVSGDSVAERELLLCENNIDFIVNCTIGFPNLFEEKGITYHRVPILDVKGADLTKHLPDAMNFINFARSHGRSVLIHCMWGMSRAPSVAIAYLIQQEKMNLADSIKQIATVRSNTRPNPSFIRQLLLWEASHSCGIKLEDGVTINGSLDLEQYKVAYQLARPTSHEHPTESLSIVESLELIDECREHSDRSQVCGIGSAGCAQAGDGAPGRGGWRVCVCGGSLMRVRRLSLDPRLAQVTRVRTQTRAHSTHSTHSRTKGD
jgi:protein-tyrosine phosphatase